MALEKIRIRDLDEAEEADLTVNHYVVIEAEDAQGGETRKVQLSNLIAFIADNLP